MMSEKERLRKQLKEDVEDFLSKGGKIKKLRMGESYFRPLHLSRRQRLKMLNTTKDNPNDYN